MRLVAQGESMRGAARRWRTAPHRIRPGVIGPWRAAGRASRPPHAPGGHRSSGPANARCWTRRSHGGRRRMVGRYPLGAAATDKDCSASTATWRCASPRSPVSCEGWAPTTAVRDTTSSIARRRTPSPPRGRRWRGWATSRRRARRHPPGLPGRVRGPPPPAPEAGVAPPWQGAAGAGGRGGRPLRGGWRAGRPRAGHRADGPDEGRRHLGGGSRPPGGGAADG